jgi:hypothetical protein
MKRDGNSQMLIQDVIEQVQAQLEEAQVTAVSAMNDTDPAIPLGHNAQNDMTCREQIVRAPCTILNLCECTVAGTRIRRR